MNRRIKAVVGLVAAGSLVLSLGVGAYAATNLNESRQIRGLVTTELRNEGSKGMTTDGQIMGGKGGRGQDGMMTGKGGHGQNGMMPGKGGMMLGGKGMDLDVDVLVTAGLIDQEIASSITEFIAAKDAERDIEREKVQAMTVEERQAYFEEKSTEVKVNLFDELVTDGILTQTQADAIHDYVQTERRAAQEAKMTAILATLVTDNTITQAQADAILANMEVQQAAREAERDLVDAMTDAERDAYFADRVKTHPLDNLVEDGTITQEQADAVTGEMGHGRR